MYFPKNQLRKTWLDKCLKSRVSEDPLTDNMANGTKHCSNLNDSTFTKLIYHCKDSCSGKSRNQFRCTYVKNKKLFLHFFFIIFKIYIKFQTFYKKRWPSQPIYFQNQRLQKTGLDKCLKSRGSEDRQRDNMANGSKKSCNLNDSTFIIFINHCGGNYVELSLFQ